MTTQISTNAQATLDRVSAAQDDIAVLIRPVVRPLVLTAIAALEQAKEHIERVIGDTCGAMTATEIEEDVDGFLWEANEELKALQHHIERLSYVKDGVAGQFRWLNEGKGRR